jgi:ribonuclease HII
MKNKSLNKFYNDDSILYEIGIDEAGRGPMFGRVYSAGVILPKNTDFQFELLKDSKKFTSEKKINEVADYIKKNALYWTVQYEDETIIDKINIRNATHSAMHKCINNIINNYNVNNELAHNKYYLLIDGNDFKPFTYFKNNIIQQISHITIEGGDNKYCSIAAASILAKVERDSYIKNITNEYKKLNECYNIEKNKGYGTSKHLEGIKKYGISPWHRKTYGLCKHAIINPLEFYL